MKDTIAQALAMAVNGLEVAARNLVNAPPEDQDERALDYLRAVEARNNAHDAARREVDLENAGATTPGTEPGEAEPTTQPVPREASPGVPLIQNPGVVVDRSGLERYGPLGHYDAKAPEASVDVLATPFAFAEGTAIATGTDAGTVAVAQPSRIVVGADGSLGVVPEDQFNETYERVEPDAEAPKPAAPAGTDPAAEAAAKEEVAGSSAAPGDVTEEPPVDATPGG